MNSFDFITNIIDIVIYDAYEPDLSRTMNYHVENENKK